MKGLKQEFSPESDCALLGNSAMPGEISGVLYPGIKLVEARDAATHLYLKFFTLLSSIRTSSPGLCPQGASVYPGRETHRQPTNQ